MRLDGVRWALLALGEEKWQDLSQKQLVEVWLCSIYYKLVGTDREVEADAALDVLCMIDK